MGRISAVLDMMTNVTSDSTSDSAIPSSCCEGSSRLVLATISCSLLLIPCPMPKNCRATLVPLVFCNLKHVNNTLVKNMCMSILEVGLRWLMLHRIEYPIGRQSVFNQFPSPTLYPPPRSEVCCHGCGSITGDPLLSAVSDSLSTHPAMADIRTELEFGHVDGTLLRFPTPQPTSKCTLEHSHLQLVSGYRPLYVLYVLGSSLDH